MIEADVARYALIDPLPWKNGLGTTTQMAVHPPGASADDFEWRVSIARVAAAATFSSFAGVSRSLAVLQGEMQLHGLGQPVVLTPGSSPLCFDGAAEVGAVVLKGPVLDLNVMYKAASWRAGMSRVQWTAATQLLLRPGQMICSLSARMGVKMGAARLELGLFDLLRMPRAVEIEVGTARPAEAYLIELQPLCG